MRDTFRVALEPDWCACRSIFGVHGEIQSIALTQVRLHWQAGAVPVYLGAPNWREFVPMNHSVIDASEFDSPEDLAKFLSDLSNDDERYQEYHRCVLDSNSITFRIPVRLFPGRFETVSWMNRHRRRPSLRRLFPI
jgi:hypothetical protein